MNEVGVDVNATVSRARLNRRRKLVQPVRVDADGGASSERVRHLRRVTQLALQLARRQLAGRVHAIARHRLIHRVLSEEGDWLALLVNHLLLESLSGAERFPRALPDAELILCGVLVID